jgi:hypothetical protein
LYFLNTLFIVILRPFEFALDLEGDNETVVRASCYYRWCVSVYKCLQHAVDQTRYAYHSNQIAITDNSANRTTPSGTGTH